MQQDRWTVYEYPRGERDEAFEISWHQSFEKAVDVATKAHDRTGLAYRIDLNVMEGSIREGFQCVEADTDRWGVLEAWTPPVIPGAEDVPVFGDPGWNEIAEEERLERERRERIEDGEETEAETQIPMPSDPNGPWLNDGPHYCEGCERDDVPLVVGRIMPRATEPVEWCEDCIASMPRAERVTWGLPYYVIRRTLSAWQTADGPYFVRSNGMPGGAVWSPNRAMGAREFITPAAAEAVIVAYHAEGRWSIEEVPSR